ncbi:restriction endonuclease subunit S [Patescibacteria group bacterium]|nr:restriction endonuclease subunit S [Patescibacteria group bacterium]MBU1124299.1 restriction endonuclease subunit S [Patescibacteria group bacterium]MBU1988777.1 restriction endonuclease subunit S [Nanoarchaeota archaeon]
MTVGTLFNIGNAKSKGFEQHDEGTIPFVTNGFRNNGIVGFVDPLPMERVIKEQAICISTFCEATVHEPPFLPRGNGGSGLIILVPKTGMTREEMYYYAAQVNKQSWRFSFGRMVINERIACLELQPFKGVSTTLSIEKLVPEMKQRKNVSISKMAKKSITDICNIERKYAPYMNEIDELDSGTPYVTTTEVDNGVSIHCNEKPNFKSNSVTVSLDGICGTTFFQFQDYIAGEKTAVVTLKEKYNPYLLLYIAALIRMMSWRYHYGRKLSIGRLEELSLKLPVEEDGNIDFDAIEKIVKNSYGWEIVDAHLSKTYN